MADEHDPNHDGGSTVPPVQSNSGTSSGLDLTTVLANVAAAVAGVEAALNTFAQQAGQSAVQQSASQQVLASLQTTVGNLDSRMSSLSEDVKKVSDNVSAAANTSDTGVNRFTDNFVVRSSIDPADNQQRMMLHRDQVDAASTRHSEEIGAITIKSLSDMVSNNDALMKEFIKFTAAKWSDQANYQAGVWARSADHFHQAFAALPPMAPRSPTGPGSMDLTKNG